MNGFLGSSLIKLALSLAVCSALELLKVEDWVAVASPGGRKHVIDILFLATVADVIDTALVAAVTLQTRTCSILLGLTTALGAPKLGNSSELVL